LTDFKWLLFDLGGVLVEYIGLARLKAWLPKKADDWELSRFWLFSPAVRAFESGKISPVVFAYDIIMEMGLNVHPDDFLEHFPDFVTGYYPGAEEMLSVLSSKYPIALLSNTNSLQWDKLCANSYADRLFRKTFLSFKTGYLKPDREAYLHVMEILGCDPHDILFFDDNPDNVRGALDTGINAIHVKGFEDMREFIANLGLL
jgi:glucose-1-phosphatase